MCVVGPTAKFIFILYFSRIIIYGAEIAVNLLYKVKILRYFTEITVHRKAKQTIDTFKGVVKDSTKIIINNDITNPSYFPDILTSLDYGFMAVKQNLLTTEELVNQISNIFSAVSTKNYLFFVTF